MALQSAFSFQQIFLINNSFVYQKHEAIHFLFTLGFPTIAYG